MKYHNFDKISDILSDVAKKSGMDFGVSQMALFNVWPSIVGNRFKNTSKAIKISGKTLTVATKSPSITQELSMFKAEILEKIEKTAKNLNIKVSEINFNHKIWAEIGKKYNEAKQEEQKIKYLPAPSTSDIEDVEVPDSIIQEIEQSISKGFDDELQNKMFTTMINDIKRQIWKRERGYPVCVKCAMVLDFIEEGVDPICPVCKNY